MVHLPLSAVQGEDNADAAPVADQTHSIVMLLRGPYLVQSSREELFKDVDELKKRVSGVAKE